MKEKSGISTHTHTNKCAYEKTAWTDQDFFNQGSCAQFSKHSQDGAILGGSDTT